MIFSLKKCHFVATLRRLYSEALSRFSPELKLRGYLVFLYIKDVYMELREDNSRMQYCTYEMFINSDGNYEDSILELCSEWERLISK